MHSYCTHLRTASFALPRMHPYIEGDTRSPPGAKFFLIQPCPAPVNDTLMELLLYIDAFRRASAHSITAVVPYFPYARQERMARGREAISARVVANALESSGVERVIFVDIHSRAIQGFFNIPVDPLSAMPVLAEYFEALRFDEAVIVNTAGFREIGDEGVALEEQLVALARKTGIRVFGPNCQGVINSDPTTTTEMVIVAVTAIIHFRRQIMTK